VSRACEERPAKKEIAKRRWRKKKVALRSGIKLCVVAFFSILFGAARKK
jgi:uncharacterized membrane protein YfcA